MQSELFMNYPVFQLHPQITLGIKVFSSTQAKLL